MRTHSKLLAILVAVSLVIMLTPMVASPVGPKPRVIVTFTDDAGKAVASGRIERLGGQRLKDLPLIGGAAYELPSPAAMRSVKTLRGVKSVDVDIKVDALGKPSKPGGGTTQPPQVLPWGIHRVAADSVWPLTTADPIKVAIVDTGIQTNHPDLMANVKGGYSAVAYTTKYNDDNGHGTHVAGIVAGVNNTIGVVGAAPAADLYAVKVLDKQGSGWLSDIIEGLQWSVANKMGVVNMSLGTPTYVAAFDTAVQNTIAAGVVVVAAAGNSGPTEGTVNYPGAFPNVIAVGATDSADNIAWFSSRGPEVTLCAPGSEIFSTYKGSTYATLSGTSMASPHVAGVAALVLNTAPTGVYNADNDGVWQPAEVRAKLIARAQDLGPAGFDSAYGYGMVRADLAVAP
jgi:subtilisin family serine protease